MKSSHSSSGVANTNIQQNELQGQAEAKQHDGYQWTALSVTTVGALLASIQGSALLIALPNILGELHATFFSIMWVLLGYLLILTVLTPVVGRLADLWGRKRLYNSGFIAFTIGSLIAGAAGFLIGPIVGGLLTEISWRWVFLFNVPIGIFGALWGIWRLREPVRPVTRQPIDWLGSITLTVGLTGVLLALTMLAFPILSEPVIIAIFIIGIVSLIAFAIIEPRIAVPIVQLRLFRDRLFAMANLSGLLNGIARGAVLFLLIFFLQGPYGQDPLKAGLMLI